MIILHNSHDKDSRDFVALHGNGNTIIDWYGDPKARDEYLTNYPPPSQFPAVVDDTSGVVINAAHRVADLNGAILDAAREKAKIRISAACRRAIEGGVKLNVLGADYFYPTKQDGVHNDQLNLNALVTMAKLYGDAYAPYKFWCADANGVWARRDHTAAQIEAVGLAVKAHVSEQQNKYEQLLAQIVSATTVAELEAIQW